MERVDSEVSTRCDELARELRRLREARGLSQTGLAKKLGCRQTAVSAMEKRCGRGSSFRVDTLELLAWALDVELVIELREKASSSSVSAETSRIGSVDVTAANTLAGDGTNSGVAGVEAAS